MKLLLATSIAGALLVALFLVPFGGRTLWQRAQARGIPQSAARAMSSGAHAAVRWAESKEPHGGAPENMPGHKPLRKDVARSAPAAAPIEHKPAASQYGEAHYRNGEPAPGAVARDPAPLANLPALVSHALAPPPTASRDRIVKAPPEESLSAKDRQGLDKLIAGSHR